jgi:hypothetical protein
MPEAQSPPQASENELAASLEGTVASLQEHINVLHILDGTAESWPGIASCMKSMRAITEVVACRLKRHSAASQNSMQHNNVLTDQLSAANRKLSLRAVTISSLREQRQVDAKRMQELQSSLDQSSAGLADTQETLGGQVQR